MLDTILFVLFFGFLMGAVYLLIALGFSLICGVLRIFHLGYAYLFPLPIYGTWFFMSELGLPLIPSIIGMVIVQLIVSYLIYTFMVKRYMDDEMTLLTGLLLVALIVDQLAAWRYPVQEGVYLQTTLMDGIWQIGLAVAPKQLILASGIALVMTALFALFFIKTKVGLAVRALSQDILNSRFVGLNVEKLYTLIMMLVLVPVIVAMLLIAPIWTVEPAMGWQYMTTAILIAVLGGLGNIKGTIIASFLIGFDHALMCFVVGEPRFMNLSALVLVMVILIVRPQGIARSESLW
ncbi:MAG: branched-chain amino acid ABC transporter permease [Syntrophaceae bacterium]|nr:branched-chain amino acid ABC transporter permease [Syntrophaceae bacterium]